MTSGFSGDAPPEPAPGNGIEEYPEKECPFCGDMVKLLPPHLRNNCEET